VCAPRDFAELLARVDVPLVPIGQPLRPPVTRATPPSAGVAAPARCRVGLPPSWTPSPRRPGNVMRRSRPARCRPGCGVTEHPVVIAGGGPKGLMLAGELALGGVDVAIVERRATQDLAGSRAGGPHSRTIEILDQRGIADRFLSEGQVAQVAGFAGTRWTSATFPPGTTTGSGLWHNHIERILAGWVGELAVPIYRGREVTGFAQDDTGVDVELADWPVVAGGRSVGCDGGRSLIRKAAGIEFPGWDPTMSSLIAEVEMAEEPELGIRQRTIRRSLMTCGCGVLLRARGRPFGVHDQAAARPISASGWRYWTAACTGIPGPGFSFVCSIVHSVPV
jgi:hypothetical protein